MMIEYMRQLKDLEQTTFCVMVRKEIFFFLVFSGIMNQNG